MNKGKDTEKSHAKYEVFEDGKHWFRCLICSNDMLYLPWEIPQHLEGTHKISRKKQVILGWSEEFEKEYQENKDRPIEYEHPPSIHTDKTPPKEYEKEKKIIQRERKAIRDN